MKMDQDCTRCPLRPSWQAEHEEAHMKKAELLKHIKEAIRTEESATSIYLKHLTALVSRANLPPDKIEKVRESIEHLIKSNERHAGILTQLQQQIEEDKHDDF
jgi:rubrerythrin